jgi:hypothetical protein
MDDGARRVPSGVNTDNAQRSGRRVSRLRLELPILVSFPGESSYDECVTVEVDALGALVASSGTMKVGQELFLTNPNSWEQITCHVRHITPKGAGVNHVGVEFATESNEFWEAAVRSSEAAEFPTVHWEIAKLTPKRWRVLSWPTFVLASLMGLIFFLFVARSNRSKPVSVPATRAIFQDVAPEVARLIPGIENYRLATPGDFDPDAAYWVTNSGQKVSGEIPGAFTALGQSHAYILVGEDARWRIVILANGQLRCDAQYRSVAVIARVPKQAIQKIIWADPPPIGSEGDGLLIVRTANDPGSSVVLFLRGNEVVSGTPTGYWQIPLSQTP